MSNISYVDSPDSTNSIEVSVDNPLPVTASLSATAVQTEAAATTSAGTIAATNSAGGTQIVAANPKRAFTQCQNNGSVDVYFGAGTVHSTFPKVVANGVFTWNSQEALKVLSSGIDANIAFIDYINT